MRFTAKIFYFPIHKRSLVKCFLLFKKGNEDREKALLATSKILRSYFNKWSLFPEVILKDYPDKFAIPTYSQPLRHNYLTLFVLSAEQSKIDNDPLESAYGCFTLLKQYFKEGDYTILKNAPRTAHLATFMDLAKQDIYLSKEDILRLRNMLGKLYKLSLLDKQEENKFYEDPPSFNLLQFIQNIPVNLASITEDIKILTEETEEQILTLAQRRWSLINLLKAYNRIG